MKKLFPFIASCFFIFFTWVCFAQVNYYSSYNLDPEKIYLFDVKIAVQTDGTIKVQEDITINARGQQIRRGIYRDLPVSLTEHAEPVSLTMDGIKHPFFTEKKKKNLRVNFGNNDYISQGRHTYSFTYLYTGAIDFLDDYDELYWNVTGNDWNFAIDKARVEVEFPPDTNIRREGISLYTGTKGSKQSNARQSGYLTFETTHSLNPKNGFTIAIAFDKGIVQKPTFKDNLKNAFSLSVLITLILLIIFVLYAIFTWLKIGRDPAYFKIISYEPPKDISPAFVYYLRNERVDAKLLSCLILDLAMKGYIAVETDGRNTSLLRLKNDTENLPPEEISLLKELFSNSDLCVLDRIGGLRLEIVRKGINLKFAKQKDAYIISNRKYIIKAVCLVLAMGIIPFVLGNGEAIFINLHYAAFALAFSFVTHRALPKIIIWLLFTAFYSVFWIGILKSFDMYICQIGYVLGILGLSFYITLIRNVTPLGKSVFEQLKGFERYIKTAEAGRVSASNPLEEERIFCDYLPFAFALGLQNQWMDKYTNILSRATIEKCMASAGGISAVSRGLTHSIGSSMPSGGGSHGGGHSGGGHGGGGGGGR